MNKIGNFFHFEPQKLWVDISESGQTTNYTLKSLAFGTFFKSLTETGPVRHLTSFLCRYPRYRRWWNVNGWPSFWISIFYEKRFWSRLGSPRNSSGCRSTSSWPAVSNLTGATGSLLTRSQTGKEERPEGPRERRSTNDFLDVNKHTKKLWKYFPIFWHMSYVT